MTKTNIPKGLFHAFPITLLKSRNTKYLEFINSQFVNVGHVCPAGAYCVTKAWSWKGGDVPKQDDLDSLLYYFDAYRRYESEAARKRRGSSIKMSKKFLFEYHFKDVVDLIRPLSNKTLLCDWDPEQIRNVYDETINLLGSTVLITKTLHFLLPELFLIVDDLQIYQTWKDEFFKGEKFNQITSATYVSFMKAQKQDLRHLMQVTGKVSLNGGRSNKLVHSGDDVKAIADYPMPKGSLNPRSWDRTYPLGKLIDDALRPPN